MSTEITRTYVNRAWTDPYRNQFSKDPPAADPSKEKKAGKCFDETAARADIRSYGTERSTYHEEMMRVMDPKAYREFQQIKKQTGGTGNPTESMRFMMNWIEDKAIKDPAMERKYGQQTKALDDLKAKFQNADIKIAGVDDDEKASDKEFSVTLTKDELHTLTYGTKEEKEALYQQIDDAMKAITDAEKELDENIPDFDFGIDTKADAAERFFAMLNGQTYRADSADNLFRMLAEQKELN